MATLRKVFNDTRDQFFNLIKKKRLPFGDLFQHTSEWYKFNKDRQNSLVLRYEEFKKDHRGHIVKIVKFLGIELSGKAIDIIFEKSTIKTMSEKYNDDKLTNLGITKGRPLYVKVRLGLG